MKISFIVLTYNRTETLLPVLRSLASQCNAAHEVLIADDGSSPEHVELLQKNCPAFNCPVRHIWHPDTGFTASAARNLGAHFSQGDYLVFLDGDCVPNKSFVAAQTWLAEQGFFVNGSRVLLGERLTEDAIRGEIDLPSQSALFWWFARLRGDSNKLLHMLHWPWSLFRLKQGFQWRGIRSCNLAVWRKDFVAVNGFDETFEGWGHEDADLVLRLCNLGVRRKNGFWATEVYHLWHRENKRDQESANRQRVIQRMATGLVVAEKGLSELGQNSLVKVQQLH
jgi:glycosyltransferase involved in cell wall biosynthesis